MSHGPFQLELDSATRSLVRLAAGTARARDTRTWACFATALALLASCGDDGSSSERDPEVPPTLSGRQRPISLDPCLAVACGEHGKCVQEGETAPSCVCDEGYGGEFCARCAEGYRRAGTDCVRSETEPAPEECTTGCPDAPACDVEGHTGANCEQCLDGWVKHADGSCSVSTCGDGIVDPARGEECDLGSGSLGNSNTVADRCRATCLRPSCGDGVVDEGEDCDDAKQGGCPATCANDGDTRSAPRPTPSEVTATAGVPSSEVVCSTVDLATSRDATTQPEIESTSDLTEESSEPTTDDVVTSGGMAESTYIGAETSSNGAASDADAGAEVTDDGGTGALDSGVTNGKDAGAPWPSCPFTLTHSSDPATIVGFNSIACQVDSAHEDNGYLRSFDLGSFGINRFEVTQMRVGVELAQAGPAQGGVQPVSARIYLAESDPPMSTTMALVREQSFNVSDTSASFITIPLAAIVDDHGGTQLAAELFTPAGNGNSFFIGSNAAGETDQGYVRAPSCSVADFTATGDLGDVAPHMHILIHVDGIATGPVCVPG